jgi:hypothetical protein
LTRLLLVARRPSRFSAAHLLRAGALATLAMVALFGAASQAVEVSFRPVAPGIFAHIGEKGGRTYENEGLNANIGLAVTEGGAVLIDSGATYRSARQIHEAIRRVTDRPVKWVINAAELHPGNASRTYLELERE